MEPMTWSEATERTCDTDEDVEAIRRGDHEFVDIYSAAGP